MAVKVTRPDGTTELVDERKFARERRRRAHARSVVKRVEERTRYLVETGQHPAVARGRAVAELSQHDQELYEEVT